MDRVVGVGEVTEVPDDLGGGEPALEDLGARRQRQRVEARKFRVGVADGLDVQEGLLDEQVESGWLRAHLGGGEDPLADR